KQDATNTCSQDTCGGSAWLSYGRMMLMVTTSGDSDCGEGVNRSPIGLLSSCVVYPAIRLSRLSTDTRWKQFSRDELIYLNQDFEVQLGAFFAVYSNASPSPLNRQSQFYNSILERTTK
ncbi:unnamed protein product, partial [Mycena citricolor]